MLVAFTVNVICVIRYQALAKTELQLVNTCTKVLI